MAKDTPHNTIKKVLKEIGKDKSICKNVTAVELEENLWIGEPKGSDAQSIFFKPEVIFERGNNKSYIFQVLDAQADSNKEVFGDLLYFILCKEASRLYLIVNSKSNEVSDEQKNIAKIVSITRSIFKHKYNHDKEMCVYPVDYSLSPEKIKKQFIKIARKEKW